MDKNILDHYNTQAEAERYNSKFDRKVTEQITDWWEQKLLRNLLAALPAGESALDIPCGCGRMFPLLRERFDRVIEADWSFGMVSQARKNHQAAGRDPKGFVRLTALALPFPDRTFDAVLSVRLSHHIRLPEERKQHLSEILRVSRKSVVFTYFDTDSMKAKIRRAQRLVRPGRREKWTLSQDEVLATAGASGFQVLKTVPLSRFFSGHNYAVLERI